MSEHVEFLRKINCSETADYIEKLEERLRLADEAIHSLEEEVGVLSCERAAYDRWQKGPSDE